MVVDVSTGDGVRAVPDGPTEALGTVDVLVNHAGMVQPLGPTAEMDLERWTGAFAVSVFAPAALVFALVPGMAERGWGKVVSVQQYRRVPRFHGGFNANAATKAALEAHTLNLAVDLKDTGVTVNVYWPPGLADTAMQDWIRECAESVADATPHVRFTSSYENRT